MTLQRTFSSLAQKSLRWLRVKKLELDLFNSRRFQKRCRNNQCFVLAELEDEYQAEIRGKIEHLKSPSQKGGSDVKQRSPLTACI